MKRSVKIYFGILAAVVILNLLSWCSTAFSDAYVAYVFPVWVSTYGRFTGIFPFSVGEWMIVAGILLVVLLVLLLPIRIFIRKDSSKKPSREKLLRFIKGYQTFFAWVLLIVALVMTLNCFILYHASTFSEKYFRQTKDTYKEENLVALWNLVAEKCNTLSAEVERDADGRVVYPGSVLENGKVGDLENKSIECMQRLGKTYPQLSGFFPRPKKLFASDFMCQQYMEGYYFPFSMEANYNSVMYIMNKPASLCHELAHLRGYIFEDEANFISFLACEQSQDVYFEYSGYLSVINYVARELSYVIKHSPDFADKGYELVSVLPQVEADNIFVVPEEWERIENKALLKTETVDKASDVFIDTTLKANGVSDGMKSYSRVVQLLLQYYEKQK